MSSIGWWRGWPTTALALRRQNPASRCRSSSLPDETGRLVTLSQLLDKGPAVISFNRGHWCPYCRLNVDALAKAEPEIASLGAQIVAISPETVKWSAELKAYAKAPFHILSDVDGGYALELNLLFWVGDEKRAAMTAGGYDISLFQGNDTWMLPIPATFVVGRNGIVRARHIDPDYRHRMEIEDLIDGVAPDQDQAARIGRPVRRAKHLQERAGGRRSARPPGYRVDGDRSRVVEASRSTRRTLVGSGALTGTMATPTFAVSNAATSASLCASCRCALTRPRSISSVSRSAAHSQCARRTMFSSFSSATPTLSRLAKR